MLGSAGSAAAGSAGVDVESWDDAADAGADADADADADAVASGDEASDAAGDVATSARVTLTESCICAICKHTRAATAPLRRDRFGRARLVLNLINGPTPLGYG